SDSRTRNSRNSYMAPPILSLALPSETGRVLSIQSHTVQLEFKPYTSFGNSFGCNWERECCVRVSVFQGPGFKWTATLGSN
ncbi:pyridoxal kinase-like, partial [Trifolium medium]|nr:pyridoxal kinase-like [Trifolium medium]